MPEERPLWATPWGRLRLTLACLGADPFGLGGIAIRARSGPARDAAVALTDTLGLPVVPLHPAMGDEALLGGLDLSATLTSGTPVLRKGLLQAPGLWRLTMAERATPAFAARLATALDKQPAALIALDEGAEPEEGLPEALSDRLAFTVDLADVPARALDASPLPRPLRDDVTVTEAHMTALAEASLTLGITSLRAPLFALRCAIAHARLMGHDTLRQQDLECAVALVLSPRATRWPDDQPAPEQDQAPEPQQTESEDTQGQPGEIPAEMLLDAVRAILPPNLLDQLAIKRAKSAKGSGSGAARKGTTRGRPLPSRPGRLGSGARIDLVATLREAAPWQPLRRQQTGKGGLHIRPADIRLKRYEERADRLLIFAVDASGSAALARLAEAKGAVELLLAEAYARRDHVALIAFRGEQADLLLPPTRSLVQTKRRLAGLPGGGGTPLAAGLKAALDLADQARRRGMTPTLALLTDGRANIALDGTPNRQQAAEDALKLARLARSAGLDALVIDTGTRPERALRTLAEALDGTYLPMPRADAERLSAAVSAALA